MKKYLISILLLIFTLALFLPGCSQKSEKPFVIGVIPTQNQGDMQKALSTLAEKIGAKLGKKAELKVYPDYNGVVEAMKYGEIDLAYFGPYTYIIAHRDSGAEAIATLLIDGKPYYHSLIIAPKDSPINSVKDIVYNSKNLVFAFGDPNSTSGSLIPGLFLKEQGLFNTPEDHKFKQIIYTGGHDATALAVENKKADLGAVDSAILKSLIKKGKIDESKIKVIWTSKPLFQYPWAVKKDTPQEVREKILSVFLEIKDPEILSIFGASGFTKASDKDYNDIREAAKKMGRF
ncbi:phosphate/phosphite/phosphonate ABC transporter substrate-binding protein [Carboxydothermus pertinax]|uniref:Phosphonate ABC transporter substrate-binding protein n=1 Tax=Carboxydothermus pertinax TaxID=870242 RepID=A0A1L8CVC0_9THEO|nr:phosphate/phosphite/phosphonate ABC transporter substrate-binding protein [Carboxydothermus pertinax]GAV22878.1 phosphonate ABC transporter substrate-binding protein [Carboxydothermus pertinax]